MKGIYILQWCLIDGSSTTFDTPKSNRSSVKISVKFPHNSYPYHISDHSTWNLWHTCLYQFSGTPRNRNICELVRMNMIIRGYEYMQSIHAPSRIHTTATFSTACTCHWGPGCSRDCTCRCWVLCSCHWCSHPDTLARKSFRIARSQRCIYTSYLL